MSNPNAVNSPHRVVPTAAGSKQKRSYADLQREDAYGQRPPAKKQMLESRHTLRTPPRQYLSQTSLEGRVFTRKSANPQPSAFERKCASVREKPVQQAVTKGERTSEENLESIRQWQKHHRKVFPTLVFYFESVPDEVRLKLSKQVIALGAVRVPQI